MKKIISFLFLWGCSICISSASANLDSIIRQYSDYPMEYQIDSLLPRTKAMMFSEPDESYEFIQKLIRLCKKKDEPLLLADCYRTLGNYFSDLKGDVDKAAAYYQSADKIYRKSNRKRAAEGVGAIYHCHGTIQQRQGKYLEAINYYVKALHVFDSIQNVSIRPRTLNNLSTLYSYLNDHPKAEEYARECYKLAIEIKDDYLISTSCVTLAAALLIQSDYDEIPELLHKAEQIALTRKDNYILSLVHLNYGSYYIDFLKDYPTAISHYKQSVLFADRMGNEAARMNSLANLAHSYYLNKQFGEAKVHAEKALVLADKVGSDDVKQRLLWLISKVQAGEQYYEHAYRNLSLAFELKDSVALNNDRQNINYLEAKYKAEKKELEIATLVQEKKLYNIIGLISIFALLFLVLAVYLRYKTVKRKRELSEQKVQQLEQEKQLIAIKAVLDGETAERSRLARDLHDGLGGMLSAVKLNLFDMKQGAFIEMENVTRFNKVVEMLDKSMKELRRVAHNMMPESLSRFGLKVALNDFCSSFDNVKFHFFGNDEKIAPKIETTVYRIVYELVNNAVKHAEANTINVQIVQEVDRLSINVQDDGIGFDPDDPKKGCGLQNIRNRVRSIDGTINVLSSAGKGTEVSIDINLNNTGDGKD